MRPAGSSNSAVLNLYRPRCATTFLRINGPTTQTYLSLAAKGRSFKGDDLILPVRNPISTASGSTGVFGSSDQLLFDDPVRIFGPLMARRWIMPPVGVTHTLKMLEHTYWWVDTEA